MGRTSTEETVIGPLRKLRCFIFRKLHAADSHKGAVCLRRRDRCNLTTAALFIGGVTETALSKPNSWHAN